MVSKSLQVLALAKLELCTDQLTTCPFFPFLSPWLCPDLRFTGVSFSWETLHLLFPLPGTLFPRIESGGVHRASLSGKPYGSPSLNHILSPAASLCPLMLLHFALWHCPSSDTVQVCLFSATLFHTKGLP